jgi:hypothetical protein
MTDPEIAAMSAVHKTLEGLEPSARQRVLEWVAKRFELSVKTGTAGVFSADPSASFSTFAELMEKARPVLEKDKALVGGYWLQIVRGNEFFGSEPLNYELKNTGHGLKNVTDCLSRLIDEKPQLVLQLRKTGTAKQARKTYKLSLAGIKRVEEMMSQPE